MDTARWATGHLLSSGLPPPPPEGTASFTQDFGEDPVAGVMAAAAEPALLRRVVAIFETHFAGQVSFFRSVYETVHTQPLDSDEKQQKMAELMETANKQLLAQCGIVGVKG